MPIFAIQFKSTEQLDVLDIVGELINQSLGLFNLYKELRGLSLCNVSLFSSRTMNGMNGPNLKTIASNFSQGGAKIWNSSKSELGRANFNKMNLRDIMRYHAFTSIFLGFATLILPHTFLMEMNDGYSHYSHEFIRLYGTMTLAIGWIVWKSQGIKDGRLARALTETFCVSYGIQSLVMLRAQFTNPSGHTVLHWLVALAFGALGIAYGYIRWVKKIKYYSLPGENGEDD